jgi:glutaredoxin 3
VYNFAEGAKNVRKPVEIYTTSSCPHCAAAREDLEWRGIAFVEYDVERDPQARARLLQLTGGTRTVPVIVEESKPVQIGWMGRGCVI